MNDTCFSLKCFPGQTAEQHGEDQHYKSPNAAASDRAINPATMPMTISTITEKHGQHVAKQHTCIMACGQQFDLVGRRGVGVDLAGIQSSQCVRSKQGQSMAGAVQIAVI